GLMRIVMKLGGGNERQRRIKQSCEGAQNAALGLPAQPQKNEVVTRQDGIYKLRHNCVIVPNDSGKNGFTGMELGNQIFPKLIFDFTRAQPLLRERALP